MVNIITWVIMKYCLQWDPFYIEQILAAAGLQAGTARLAGQRLTHSRSGGGLVDNTLYYQSRDSKIESRLSGLSDETLNRGPASV